YSLKYRYIVQSYRGRTQSLVAEKTDISENRASRNFDLMIIRWRLLKITLQASPRTTTTMASAENNTSGPVPQSPVPQCSNDVCLSQFRPRSSSNDF
ncbi:hypothetical protein Tco_0342210, partial [Tanacetum coccineum]